MATPQVTGAMAVLMQYLREHYDYEEAELRQVAANLMMSTANPVMEGELEYSPQSPRCRPCGSGEGHHLGWLSEQPRCGGGPPQGVNLATTTPEPAHMSSALRLTTCLLTRT